MVCDILWRFVLDDGSYVLWNEFVFIWYSGFFFSFVFLMVGEINIL